MREIRRPVLFILLIAAAFGVMALGVAALAAS